MADELGPIAPDAGLHRGELPSLLTDLLLVQAEVAAAVAPWLAGSVDAPLIQLQHLARKLQDLNASAATAYAEARLVYGETMRRRDAAQAEVGAS